MPASKHRIEITVGLFVLLGVGLLAWLIFHFGQFRFSEPDGYPITVEVKDATGIRKGVPVRLGGVDIGNVSSDPSLSEDYRSLVVTLQIFANEKIPNGSRVKVGTSGLMGDSFVRVIPPEDSIGGFMPAGHHILAESADSLNDLAGSAGETLEEVTFTAAEIRALTTRIDTVFRKIDDSFLTEENLQNVAAILVELRTASERVTPLLDEASLTFKELSGTATSAQDTFASFDTAVEEFTATLATVDPVVEDFDATLKTLNGTLKSTNALITEIESGNGLSAAFLKDSELKKNLESFLHKLDRNGLLLYPKEGGLLGNQKESEPNPIPEKRSFPAVRKQP